MKMDDVTQQNTALVEEAAAAAESMMEQTDELMNAVSVFQLEGESQVKRTTSIERRIAHNPMRSTTSKPVVRSEQRLLGAKSVKLVSKSGTDDGEWDEF